MKKTVIIITHKNLLLTVQFETNEMKIRISPDEKSAEIRIKVLDFPDVLKSIRYLISIIIASRKSYD